MNARESRPSFADRVLHRIVTIGPAALLCLLSITFYVGSRQCFTKPSEHPYPSRKTSESTQLSPIPRSCTEKTSYHPSDRGTGRPSGLRGNSTKACAPLEIAGKGADKRSSTASFARLCGALSIWRTAATSQDPNVSTPTANKQIRRSWKWILMEKFGEEMDAEQVPS